MGTPEFAVPTLTALIKAPAYQVVAVVTQPDRPRGRGKKLTPPPVKVTALEAGLLVLQPPTLREADVVAELAALEPTVIIVAAFGQILKPAVLNLPPRGCLNVHASLLPRWRGAAPVAAAIRAGDTETGVTLMLIDEGLDTGPMIAQRPWPIKPDHTRESLTAELAVLGAELMIDSLPSWLARELVAQPQDDDQATLAPQLSKTDGEIDWHQSADQIERQVRALQPWPGTFTEGPRGLIKILAVQCVPEIENPHPQQPGMVFNHNRHVYVSTGQGVLQLETVQPAGKKPMTAQAMLNGYPDLWGAKLGH